MKNNIVFTVDNTIYQVTQDNSLSNTYWFYRREIHDKNDIKSVAKTLAREQKKKLWGKYVYSDFAMVFSAIYWIVLTFFLIYIASIINTTTIMSSTSLFVSVLILFFSYFLPFISVWVVDFHDKMVKEKKNFSRDDYKEIVTSLKNIENVSFTKKNTYKKHLGYSYRVGSIIVHDHECDFLEILLDPYRQVVFAQIFDLFAQDDLSETQHEKLQEAMENYVKKYIDQQKYIVKEDPYSNIVDLILQDSKKGILIDNQEHDQ